MEKVKLFSSTDGLFSEKVYNKEIQKEKEIQKKLHKELKEKQKEEEKKRKLLEKINLKKRPEVKAHQSKPKNKKKNNSSTKLHLELITKIKELKKKFHSDKPKIKKLKKTAPIEKLNLPTISVHIPTKAEMKEHLERLSEKYDKGIIEVKITHEKLQELGLTEKGMTEIKNESIKKREKRMHKIREVHEKLIKKIEENKAIEREIDFLHKKSI
jgi:hypothetical protein